MRTLLVLTFSLIIFAQTCIPASEYSKMLGIGINVDWLTFKKVHDAYFYWRSLGVNVAKYFKEAGFDTVRIRVSADVLKDERALKELVEVVNDSLSVGLNPIVAYAAPELRADPLNPKAQEHFIRWWLKVAETFKDYPHNLAYDLIIETGKGLKDKPLLLNKLYSILIAKIRKIDPCRIIIVTPAKVSSPFMLKYLNVTNDGFVMAEWHIYAKGPCKRRKYFYYNETLIVNAFKVASEWSNKTGIPTWFGAWRPICPDPLHRGKILGSPPLYMPFIKFMCSQIRKYNIPFAINADSWFFDISSLKWREDTMPILNYLVRCVGNR